MARKYDNTKQGVEKGLVSSTHILQGIFSLGIRRNYARPVLARTTDDELVWPDQLGSLI